MNHNETIIYAFLLLIAYVPIFIMSRYLPLRAGFKLFFGLTTPILFISLMLINIWLADKLFPHLLDLIKEVSGWSTRSHRLASEVAFLISCPIALIGTYFYYHLIKHYGKIVDPISRSNSIKRNRIKIK